MKTLIERRVHKMLKNANRIQMTAYLDSVYASGYEDGQKAASGLNADEVYRTLLKIPGIGKFRAVQIIEALNLEMDEQQDIVYPCGSCGRDLYHVKGAKFCNFCGAKLTWDFSPEPPVLPGQVDIFGEDNGSDQTV